MTRRSDVCAIFAGAAAARLVYLLVAAPPFMTLYWELSRNLIQHGTLGFDGTVTTDHEPLYPLFLAAARVLTHDRILLVQAIQALVDSAAAVALYLLAESLTGRRRVAILAAVLYAITPLLVRHAVVSSESAVLPLLLIAFAVAFIKADGPLTGVAAGVCLGLAMLTRTMTVPLVAMAAAILVFERRARLIVPVVSAALTVLSPLVIRNHGLNGSLLPTRSGINLFIGNSHYVPALLPAQSPDALQAYAESIAVQHGIPVPSSGPADQKAADALFTRLAIQEVRERPGGILWLKLRNIGYFFWPRLVPEYLLTEDTTVTLEPDGRVRIDNSPVRPWIEHLAYTVPYLVLAFAALAGLWIRGRDIRRDLLLWAIVLTFLAAGVVYFPATRYRAPAEFVLLFYAAVAVDALVKVRLKSDPTHI
jgi:4-amino-4-deoxy-L-arabinose transferase-like glycosyltransferase